jgi:hypothetical protein
MLRRSDEWLDGPTGIRGEASRVVVLGRKPMDQTLLWVGLTLVIGGFLVNLLGVWFVQKGLLPYDAGSWTDWVGEALTRMFTALPKAIGSYGWGIKIQAFGSALTYVGVAFLLVFLWG